MVKLLDWIARSLIKTVSVSLSLIVAIGILDFLTGFALSVSLLYIFPVTIATWSRGWRFGIPIAFLAASVWSVAQYASGFPVPHPVYPLWNTLMRFCVLATVGYAFSFLKLALETEMRAARIDPLTGIANRRKFLGILETELNRSNHSRRPFSVAYFDLDDFKKLNDTSGHSEGDRALCAAGAALKKTCRRMDLPGRIGGDEFALLLPETDEAIARSVIERFRARFAADIEQNQWTLGVSIGVINCSGNHLSAWQILNAADRAMYKAKRAGKNRVYFEVL